MGFRGLLAASLVLATACNGESGAANGYYLRFDVVGPYPNGANFHQWPDGALGAGFEYDGRLLVPGHSGVDELTDVGPVNHLPDIESAVLHDGAIYGLRGGEVVRTTDLVAVEVVATEAFATLGATTDALYGARELPDLSFAAFRSTDGGSTWTQLLETFTVPGEAIQALRFSGGDGELLWLSAVRDVDVSANVLPAAVLAEVRGESLTVVSQYPDVSAVPPLLGTDDLWFQSFVGVGEFADQLPIGFVREAAAARSVEDFEPLFFASPLLVDFYSSAAAIGLDAEGRLLVVVDGTVLRSQVPATRANNQRGEILAGPGCARRNGSERQFGDSVTVTVENTRAAAVHLREIDNLGRWYAVGRIEPGATLSVNTDGGAYLMASEPADDTCLEVWDVPDADGKTFTVR